jgi:hypothetical protein
VVAHLVALREWDLSTRRDVTRRVSSLADNTFDQLRYVLTSLGRRLNFGISGRCSPAGARHQEGVTIHIGRDKGESLVEILQQLCENFRRNIEARGLKAFSSDSNV